MDYCIKLCFQQSRPVPLTCRSAVDSRRQDQPAAESCCSHHRRPPDSCLHRRPADSRLHRRPAVLDRRRRHRHQLLPTGNNWRRCDCKRRDTAPPTAVRHKRRTTPPTEVSARNTNTATHDSDTAPPAAVRHKQRRTSACAALRNRNALPLCVDNFSRAGANAIVCGVSL